MKAEYFVRFAVTRNAVYSSDPELFGLRLAQMCCQSESPSQLRKDQAVNLAALHVCAIISHQTIL